MKRLVIGALIFLLLSGALVSAQDEWVGQQWEYLILQVNADDDSVTILPMIGDVLDIGLYNNSVESKVEDLADAFYENSRADRFLYPFYLQVLGEDGWELTIEYRAAGLSLGQIFKRPKAD